VDADADRLAATVAVSEIASMDQHFAALTPVSSEPDAPWMGCGANQP
jgi:hypothetical protein